MWWTSVVDSGCIAMLLMLPLLFAVVGSIKDVKIDVPIAVKLGDIVTLRCTYDLGDENLYSVKWYKGRHEFFRFVAKESPPIKIFPLPGMDVDISKSSQDRVVLRNAHWELSGRYKCEVTADHPHFNTALVTAQMQVVAPPVGTPTMKFEKMIYGVGDTLRGNCSSPPSVPASNITWLVNGNEVKSSFESIANDTTTSGQPVRSVRTSGMEFFVTNFHFAKLHIICTADLYDKFNSTVEIALDEEKPKLAPSIFNSYGASTGVPNICTKYTFYFWILGIVRWCSAIRISR